VCHDLKTLSLNVDAINAQAGVILAMTALATEIGTLTILENDDLLRTVLIDDGEGHACAFDPGLTNNGIIAVTDEQDIINRELLIYCVGQTLYVEYSADFGAVLPTT
jgi:hypothetical protein